MYHLIFCPKRRKKVLVGDVGRERYPELLKLPSLWTRSFFA